MEESGWVEEWVGGWVRGWMGERVEGSLIWRPTTPKEVEELCRGLDSCKAAGGEGVSPIVVKGVARELAAGSIVGWFQGRMEYGPRALGNRSILGDPRSERMQDHINLQIKERESFRPFAPVVLAEDAAEYFDLAAPSPYMNLVAAVQPAQRHPVPEDYPDWPIRQKLAFVKSRIPAVTHVDFSARIQTVERARNFRLWRLIHTFKQQTGCGLLINTSFKAFSLSAERDAF